MADRDLGSDRQPSLVGATLQYKWLVAAVAGAIGLAAFLYSLSRPPEFVAISSVVLKEQPVTSVVGLTSGVNADRAVLNQLEIFRSTAVASKAVELAGSGGVEVSIRQILTKARFGNLDETDVVTVTFRHPDEQAAVVVVGALVDAYQSVRREQTQAETKSILSQLASAESLLEQQLTDLGSLIAAIRDRRGLSTRIADVLDEMAETARQLSETVPGSARDDLLDRQAELETELRALQLALDIESNDANLAPLIRQEQTVIDQLSDLASRKTEVQIDAETDDAGVSFVSPAAVTGGGGGTGRLFTVLAGVVLGGLAAVGLAYVLASRRQRFEGRFEPQELLGWSFLGDIPTFDGPSLLPMRDAPRSPEAEAFRFVAGSLEFRMNRMGAKRLLVVSTTVGEGKSTVVVNTAVALARSGRRVLVVDADFGHQAVSQLLLGDIRRGPGLTEVINRARHAEDAIVPVEVADKTTVDLLSRGLEPMIASDVFSSQRPAEILNDLDSAYDLIVVDGPPLMQVAYASTLARLADAALIVVPDGASISAVEELGNRLAFMEVSIAGYVYNKARRRAEMDMSSGSMHDILGDMGLGDAAPSRVKR